MFFYEGFVSRRVVLISIAVEDAFPVAVGQSGKVSVPVVGVVRPAGVRECFLCESSQAVIGIGDGVFSVLYGGQSYVLVIAVADGGSIGVGNGGPFPGFSVGVGGFFAVGVLYF